MATGGNFEDELKLFTDPVNKKVHVDAQGPAYGDVVELCVWIIQKQGASDAAATQITMIPGRGNLKSVKLKDGTTGWGLRALQASTKPLQPGPAIAMAIALFLEDGEEQAQLWAQSVELKT